MEARDEFVASGPPVAARPLVAASVGPYGAILADGSEYRGYYALDERGLARFHRDRLALLAAALADLLAVETIPSLAEARVLARLLADLALPAWVAFSCADGGHLRDGSRIEDAALLCVGVDNVGAIGVNCTAPEHVGALVKRLARAAPAKDIIVYPNRGESWSAARGTWSGTATPPFAEAATWLRAGARLIGGCCRTTPEDIATLRGTLSVAGARRLHE